MRYPRLHGVKQIMQPERQGILGEHTGSSGTKKTLWHSGSQVSSRRCSPDDAHVIRELGKVAELKRRRAFPEAFVLHREHSEVALFSDGKLNRLVLAITPSSPYLSDADTLRRLESRANDATRYEVLKCQRSRHQERVRQGNTVYSIGVISR